jgi:hypothetical protein
LIEIITTSIIYLKLKENNENDMAAQYMEFVLIFSPADGQAPRQLCQSKCLLTLASLFEATYKLHRF